MSGGPRRVAARLRAVSRSTSEVLWDPQVGPRRIEISASSNLGASFEFNALRIFELDTWESRVLPFEFGRVRGLAFNDSGTRLAVGDEDRLTIVDLENDVLLQTVPISGVSDGHWLSEAEIMIGTNAGVWAVISLETSKLVADARAAVARSFSESECRIYRIDPCPTLDEIRNR